MTLDFVAESLGEEALPGLKDLSLPRAALTDIMLVSGNEYPLLNLVTINLDGNQLVSFGALGYLPYLRSLSLKNNRIRRMHAGGCVNRCSLCNSVTFLRA